MLLATGCSTVIPTVIHNSKYSYNETFDVVKRSLYAFGYQLDLRHENDGIISFQANVLNNYSTPVSNSSISTDQQINIYAGQNVNAGGGAASGISHASFFHLQISPDCKEVIIRPTGYLVKGPGRMHRRLRSEMNGIILELRNILGDDTPINPTK